MHLITTSPDGGLCLKEFVGNSIPPYAILSHTWGPDDQEVTYRDLNSQVHTTASAPYFLSRYMQKPGYRKLEFCVNRAAQDGLQYSWVDTCCIDKSSSVELSEAINSMFRWYREAAVCYVFLADVSSPRPRAISSSRWFTRGWTLQELLAPTHLQFFTVDGTLIGDKSSSPDYLHQITRIPVSALNGNKSLLEFSVEERLSWAQGRETKREEDMAYCLLGLFDIHMPLLYGEGRKKASNRLMKEIKAMEDDEKQLATNTTPQLPSQSSFGGHQTSASPDWQKKLDKFYNGTSMSPPPNSSGAYALDRNPPNTYTNPPLPLPAFSLGRGALTPPASDPFMLSSGIYYPNALSYQQPHLPPYNGLPVPVARSRSMIHGSRSSYYGDEKPRSRTVPSVPMKTDNEGDIRFKIDTTQALKFTLNDTHVLEFIPTGQNKADIVISRSDQSASKNDNSTQRSAKRMDPNLRKQATIELEANATPKSRLRRDLGAKLRDDSDGSEDLEPPSRPRRQPPASIVVNQPSRRSKTGGYFD